MDKLQLIKLVEEGSTHREIAQKMNCAQSTIRYWMNKYGLKSKNFKIGDKEFYSTDRFLNINAKSKTKNFLEIQSIYDSGLSWVDVSKKAEISLATIMKYTKMGVLKSRTASESLKISKNKRPKRKLSKETKLKISVARKKWLKENPDKHPWQNKSFVHSSVPCEKFKSFLKEQNIDFIEEYLPVVHIGRFFRIDIAFPDKKVAIEVNGNQHYESNGELKPYYKERQSILEENGWTVYQVHHTACFNPEKLSEFMDKVNSSEKKIEFDYFNYVPREKKKYFCACGNIISKKSKVCPKCYGLSNRKIVRPTKDELQKLIWEKPLIELGKQFGVSDSAVKKWCKNYGITDLPNNSYRQKIFHNKK